MENKISLSLTAWPLASSSKNNHVSSVQFSSVTSLCTRFNG